VGEFKEKDTNECEMSSSMRRVNELSDSKLIIIQYPKLEFAFEDSGT
jgi:hypothetical protein